MKKSREKKVQNKEKLSSLRTKKKKEKKQRDLSSSGKYQGKNACATLHHHVLYISNYRERTSGDYFLGTAVGLEEDGTFNITAFYLLDEEVEGKSGIVRHEFEVLKGHGQCHKCGCLGSFCFAKKNR